MKRLFIILICLLIVVSMSACSNEQQEAIPIEQILSDEFHYHDYIELKKNATCIEDGIAVYLCRCKDVCARTIAASGHKYSVSTTLPTKENRGYDNHTCSICFDTYVDNYTDPVVEFTKVEELVYAIDEVNIRTGPSIEYEIVSSLQRGDSVKRIAIGDNNWSKIIYEDSELYINSNYLSTKKPPIIQDDVYPMTYKDDTATIVIYKEWYKNAYVYAAHIEFTDYSRFGTSCANGKYGNGYETTSHAAERLDAVFAVNGCYSAPYLNYTVVRSGRLCNGKNRSLVVPAVYSSYNGKLLSAWETGGNKTVTYKNISTLVSNGLVTDTFCFGPPNLQNGIITGSSGGARAQRTFMGTNGDPGDIWICVSDGRKNDGKSAGLTYTQCMQFLKDKGCTFGIPLDGGGSSTMYFNGKVLNAAKNGQRAVVDFVYFK